MRRPCAAATLFVVGTVFAATAPAGEKIEDNSFLIEEAYNQEDGVIQHIQTFQWDRTGHAWLYSFTQEWPTPRQNHQLSFTIPVVKGASFGTGFGDILLNYRYQAVLTERFAFAPRISFVLPTGAWREAYGKGGAGIQVGLPVSADVSERVTVHVNAGATWTPQAVGSAGIHRATLDTSAGGSAVVHVSSTFDTFVELLGARIEAVRPDGSIGTVRAVLLNPGVRFAINRPSGLQVVPGFAYTIGIGPSSGSRAMFLYLSFEHPLECLKKHL
ncbi:MAG TPA: hypothetical protein VMT45_12720 [Thermoanaerobaculaceae bacterium]|nr:hypothetical protein [Thermoanaerobaculaceae bacterium]